MLLKRKFTFSALLMATVFGVGVATAPTLASAATDDTYQWKTFNDVDVDRSGFVEDDEYRTYTFGMADWDNDGYLEETEWASYTETFYDPWDVGYDSFTQYDTDGDGFIERTEFDEFAAAPNESLYSVWGFDADDGLDEGDWDQVTAYFYDEE